MGISSIEQLIQCDMLMGLICVWYKNFNDSLDLFKMDNKNNELTKKNVQRIICFANLMSHHASNYNGDFLITIHMRCMSKSFSSENNNSLVE
jgi:hypothetical protein